MADLAALVAALAFFTAITLCTIYGMRLYHERRREELSIQREEMQRKAELVSEAIDKGRTLPGGF